MRKYHLFISHSWSYSDFYDRLIELLNEAGYFSFKDYSVPKDDQIHNAPTNKKLTEAIREQMLHASVVVVLAGVYATHSKWIGEEIRLAKAGFSTAKKILAVEPWGSEKTSSLVKASADLIVSWNSKSIVDGIKRLV